MTAAVLAFWALLLAGGLALADDRLEVSASYRSLGFRDLNEPKSFTPSSAFVPDHPGWRRNWSETRAYAGLAWRLVDTDRFVLAPGFHLGTSVGRFEAKNVGIGYGESWETKPALLWGPSLRLLVRQGPGQGVYLLARYELFVASAPEGREDVSSASGTATPPSMRDAYFSWTSHEVTVAVGYDWGRVAFAVGAALTAFHLDKRLTHHIDPTGATGNALAALVALDSQVSRYAYVPQSLFAPYCSVTFRPLPRLSLEASLRPAAQPDCTLSLAVSF